MVVAVRRRLVVGDGHTLGRHDLFESGRGLWRRFEVPEAVAARVKDAGGLPGAGAGDVLPTAARIAANAPISVRQAKKSIHNGMQVDLATGLNFEVQAYDRMITPEDRREGILAFNEKRKPNFKGR